MTQQHILNALSEIKIELKEKYGIEKIALFGSYARNEANETSDIDIAILKAKNITLSNRLNAKNMLEKKLNVKVDLGYFDSMKTFIKNRIQKEFIYV